MSSDQKNARPANLFLNLGNGTPLILDLNDNGVMSQSIDSGVRFDLFATGTQVATGWTDPGDGFLVLDRNHDGLINDGTELFGDSTFLANGKKANDGYQALADMDSNHDGFISNTDINFADLKVWTDTNSNGITDAGELLTLQDLGVVSLDVNATPTSTKDNGNTLGLVSNYQTNDGNTHTLADVWFVADKPKAASAITTPNLPPIAPTEMQMGVTSLVDALASYGHHHIIRKLDMYADEGNEAFPRTASPVSMSSTTNQLVQALSQFDANGNQVVGQNNQQSTIAGLAATDPNKQTDSTAGLLTVGKG